MWIKRLKLVNFIGIKSGMGKDEIELNFPDPKDDTPFVKISGGNGSGKTTILSMLSPYKDTFTERDKAGLIIPGKEGLKEIEYVEGEHTYLIKHIYRKAASSFFYKDGVLLNENGSVNICNELIESELHLTPSYFEIGKIGSNAENFIDLKPTARKAFITEAIPQLAPFNTAFTEANQKFRDQKSMIDETGEQLSKYSDLSALKAKIAADEDTIKVYDTKISTAAAGVALANDKKSRATDILSKLDHTKDINDLDIATKEKANTEVAISAFEAVNGKKASSEIDEIINTARISKAKEETSISTKQTAYTEALKNKVDAENDLTANNIKIQSNVVGDFEQAKKKLEDLKKSKGDFEEKFASDPLYAKISNNWSSVNADIVSFKKLMQTIYENYAILSSSDVFTGHQSIHILFSKSCNEIMRAARNDLNAKASSHNTDYDKDKLDKATKEANSGQLEILQKRPADCHIDTCPFIMNALKYKGLPEELAKLDAAIKDLEELKKQDDDNNTRFQDTITVFREVANDYKAVDTKTNIAYIHFVTKYGKVGSYFGGDKKDTDLFTDYNKAAASCVDLLDSYNKYIKVCSDLRVADADCTTISKAAELKDSLLRERKKMETKRDDADKIIAANEKIVKDSKEKTDALENKINAFSGYKTLLSSLTTYENLIKSASANIKSFNDATGDFNSADIAFKVSSADKTLYEGKRKELQDAVTKDKIDYSEADTLTKNLKKLKDEYASTELVKCALDPKSGIPLVFIKAYLTETERITNELLNIAYKGKFSIKFNVTDREFFVTVLSGTSVIEDVTYASQGEVALTTISLSLALIERSSKGYNVICLDEIDGPLDDDNRSSFIGIINSQIRKLGAEQVFVISHNDAFDACKMNLILLRDYPDDVGNPNYMSNKKIIFELGQ